MHGQCAAGSGNGIRASPIIEGGIYERDGRAAGDFYGCPGSAANRDIIEDGASAAAIRDLDGHRVNAFAGVKDSVGYDQANAVIQVRHTQSNMSMFHLDIEHHQGRLDPPAIGKTDAERIICQGDIGDLVPLHPAHDQAGAMFQGPGVDRFAGWMSRSNGSIQRRPVGVVKGHPLHLADIGGILQVDAGGQDGTLDIPQGMDLVGGVQALLQADVPAGQVVSASDMNDAEKIVETRVNGLGVSEAVVQPAGGNRIVVELPGETDPAKALDTIKQTGLLEFIDMSSLSSQQAAALVNTKINTDWAASTTGNTVSPTATPEGSVTPTETITSTATTTPTVPTGPTFHTVMTGVDIKSVNVQTQGTAYATYILN